MRSIESMSDSDNERMCHVCGCTDRDCANCVRRTGDTCSWVDDDLCSACAGLAKTMFNIELSPKARRLVQQLASTGLHGTTPKQVVELIVYEGLRHVIADVEARKITAKKTKPAAKAKRKAGAK